MKSSEVRRKFLEFFEQKGHEIVDSAPMIMKDDPTLMFTNAGMNQFKDVFLGNRTPKAVRVADTQKCLRVSGKHNDLEEVGVDTYHHTMFEMLGNWSFGDYFKEEAIAYAFELLVDVYGLDKDRLYATYFDGDAEDGLESDTESLNIWKKYLDESRILGFGKKDNFWEMGEIGPCGPCSEIHMDLRSEEERKKVDAVELVNADHPQVIEIWNLVFMQFNRNKDRSLKELPNKHVDTGMGFERLVRALNSKNSNYDTDLFVDLIHELEKELPGMKYQFSDSKIDVAFRVIVDHLRAVSFSIAEGQLPSNTGAGYVIRRILRRAIRYAYSFLNVREPIIYKIVPRLVAILGEVFEELTSQKELVQKVIREEEDSFLKTLEKGIELFEDHLKKNPGLKQIDGGFAFELYDTYGFPLDLTQLLASEKGIESGVDTEAFQMALQEQKQRSRDAGKLDTHDWVDLMEDNVEEFIGYDELEAEVRIVRYRKVEAKNKTFYQLVFNLTPFYPEGGGQVGDQGLIKSTEEEVKIINTLKENNVIIHVVPELPGNPELVFNAKVDHQRRKDAEKNHSATHLLHQALRSILGSHVEQKGSLVHPDYLRFDFSHFERVSEGQLEEIEQLVNELIRKGIALDEHRSMPINEAKSMGAMALFGEKYGDVVRVIRFGESVELCGGTHVDNTAQIGRLKIISEGSVSAGVRRIEAITGRAADQHFNNKLSLLSEVEGLLKRPANLTDSVKKLLAENQELKKELDKISREKAQEESKGLDSKTQAKDGFQILIEEVQMPSEEAKNLVFKWKKEHSNGVVALACNQNDKVILNVGLGQKAIDELGLSSKDLIASVASIIQGGGGGQDHFATAGGKSVQGIQEALSAMRKSVEEAISARA